MTENVAQHIPAAADGGDYAFVVGPAPEPPPAENVAELEAG